MTVTANRPAQIPEKFWDATAGGVRIDALLKAYQELERRMGSMVRVPAEDSDTEELAAFRRALGVPDSPDGYSIEQRHEMLAADADINRRLHEAGFTPRQAQLVYDLAFERVIPMLEDMERQFQCRHGLEKLKDHFGGEARWTETARQLAAWGKSNLPAHVYEALASTPEGVIALQRMMGSGEPIMGRVPTPADEAPSEDQLKEMMKDPRYWKKRDPAFIEKVSNGFKRIYGED